LRFITFDLLAMHVADAYRADRELAQLSADDEGDKQRTTLCGAPDRDQSVLQVGVLQIRSNPLIAAQQRLDFGNLNTMLRKLLPCGFAVCAGLSNAELPPGRSRDRPPPGNESPCAGVR
jgi:hypothetical protein